jgi:uncharacterized protein YjbI with pentapeptide repeats
LCPFAQSGHAKPWRRDLKDLNQANLRGTDPRDADLRGANLMAAGLRDAVLVDAYLGGCRPQKRLVV